MPLPYRRCQISSPNKKVGAKEPFQTTVKTPIASVKTMEWVAWEGRKLVTLHFLLRILLTKGPYLYRYS